MTQEMVMVWKKTRQIEEDSKHGDLTTFTLIPKKLLLLLPSLLLWETKEKTAVGQKKLKESIE